MSKTNWHGKAALLALVAGSLFAAEIAQAQQMGRQPYGGAPRNASMATQLEMQQRNVRAAERSAAAMSSLQYIVTTYNSSSTAIGNLNEVTQILSGGSTGSVGQSTDQASTGNQGSEAVTDVLVDNTDRSRTDVAGDQNNPSWSSTLVDVRGDQVNNNHPPAE